jgi:hypothetical protein
MQEMIILTMKEEVAVALSRGVLLEMYQTMVQVEEEVEVEVHLMD